jgi:hypothetical protein
MTTPQAVTHALMPLAQNSLTSVKRTGDVRYWSFNYVGSAKVRIPFSVIEEYCGNNRVSAE